MKTYHLISSIQVCILLIGLTLVPFDSYAEDNWNVDGEHGELYVYGSLREGPCRLDMRSAWQEIVMKSISTGTLLKPGDTGEATTFSIRLNDCQRTGGEQTNIRTGAEVSDVIQPIVSISFSGVLDPNNPSLLLMKGIGGVGLMIKDRKGNQVNFGERGVPQFLSPGSNELVYTITPVRTRAPVVGGTFHSVIDFKVSYD